MEWNGFRVVGSVEDDTVPQPTKLVDQLEVLLADTSIFYHTVHEFHWNVMGTDFYEYHKLFDDIVSDVYESIDPIAENIRKLGSIVSYDLSSLLQTSTLKKEKTDSTEAKALTSDLFKLNSSLIDTLNKTFDFANKENQQGIANFIAERIDKHQKWGWFLKASNEG